MCVPTTHLSYSFAGRTKRRDGPSVAARCDDRRMTAACKRSLRLCYIFRAAVACTFGSLVAGGRSCDETEASGGCAMPSEIDGLIASMARKLADGRARGCRCGWWAFARGACRWPSGWRGSCGGLLGRGRRRRRRRHHALPRRSGPSPTLAGAARHRDPVRRRRRRGRAGRRRPLHRPDGPRRPERRSATWAGRRASAWRCWSTAAIASCPFRPTWSG